VNATFAIAAASMRRAGGSTTRARRQVTTDPLPPADDAQQAPPFIIMDLTHPQAFGHRLSLEDQDPRETARPGKGDLLRH